MRSIFCLSIMNCAFTITYLRVGQMPWVMNRQDLVFVGQIHHHHFQLLFEWEAFPLWIFSQADDLDLQLDKKNNTLINSMVYDAIIIMANSRKITFQWRHFNLWLFNNRTSSNSLFSRWSCHSELKLEKSCIQNFFVKVQFQEDFHLLVVPRPLVL